MQTLMRVHQFATLPQAAHVSEACHGYSTIAPNVHMSLLNCCSCRSHFSSYRPTTAHRSRSASMAGAEVPAPAGLPARALLIQARWLEPIFAGDKTWEVRGKNLHLRGRACLAHGGHLVGEVEFIDTHPIGTRDAGNAPRSSTGPRTSLHWPAAESSEDLRRGSDHLQLLTPLRVGHEESSALYSANPLSPSGGGDTVCQPHSTRGAGKAITRQPLWRRATP